MGCYAGPPWRFEKICLSIVLLADRLLTRRREKWLLRQPQLSIVSGLQPVPPVPTPGSRVALQASNGQYVCAEGGGGQAVVANRNAIGPGKLSH